MKRDEATIPTPGTSEYYQQKINTSYFKISSRTNIALDKEYVNNLSTFANTVVQLKDNNIESAKTARQNLIDYFTKQKDQIEKTTDNNIKVDGKGLYDLKALPEVKFSTDQETLVTQYEEYKDNINVLGEVINALEETDGLF
jgi:Holliday junction resolvase